MWTNWIDVLLVMIHLMQVNDKEQTLTWYLKQSQKVCILVGRNFFSWDKIFVFYDWSILFWWWHLKHWNNLELDHGEQRPFVDRNYYKNSFFEMAFSVSGNWNEELQKCFWNFSKEETISEELSLLSTYIRYDDSLGAKVNSLRLCVYLRRSKYKVTFGNDYRVIVNPYFSQIMILVYNFSIIIWRWII